MNRRLLLLVSSPALFLGLFLLGACAVGLWTIHNQQNRLLRSYSQNVVSLRAVHDMQMALSRLRYNRLVQMVQPNSERQQRVENDEQAFRSALDRLRKLTPPTQASGLLRIEEGFQRYVEELRGASDSPVSKPDELVRWMEAHPIRHVMIPCQELLEDHQLQIEAELQQSREWSGKLQFALFFLGMVGPIGGLVIGHTIARILSHSIGRLQVRVQDVHSRVAPEVSVVDLVTGHGLEGLNTHLDFLVQRVQGLVERLQAQQREIVHSEQLALAGQLASGVAHEIRNPLTAMKWLLEGTVRAYPTEPLTLEDLRVLLGEIERMEQTVQGMLDLVRPSQASRSSCDFRDLVQKALELVRARKRQLGITCDVELPSEPVRVQVDPAQMKSVLVNLLLNALDAMPQGGRLHLQLQRCPGGGARLQLDDSGHGIAPEVLDRLFTPFISTKPTGTGLGLSVARRIVEAHGGQLSAENRPEGGARFLMTLPAGEPAALAAG